jgi:hypothetical protein
MKKHILTGLMAILICFSCNTIKCGTGNTENTIATTINHTTKSCLLKKATCGVIGVAIIAATAYYIYENPGSFDLAKIKQLSWDYLQKAQGMAISTYEFARDWALYGYNLAKYWFGAIKETMAIKRSVDIVCQVGKVVMQGCRFGKNLLSRNYNRLKNTTLPCWGTKAGKNPVIN